MFFKDIEIGTYYTLIELLDSECNRFKQLIGRKIEAVYCVWEEEANEWYSDVLVVLKIGDIYLGISNEETERIDVYWNNVDVEKALPNFDYGDGLELKFKWTDSYAPFNNLCNKTLIDIEINEYLHMSKTLYSVKRPESTGITNHDWLLSGMSFVTEDSYVCIYNALDENGVSTKRDEDENFRSYSIKESKYN